MIQKESMPLFLNIKTDESFVVTKKDKSHLLKII